jgi:hypothetical protein
MTSIHCANSINYQYNDLEKQLPEYHAPSNIGEHYYVTILFSGDDMDITNMTENDTEDTLDKCDEYYDDSDIENAKASAHNSSKRKPRARASRTTNNILSNFVTKFLNMINQVRLEYREDNNSM